MKKFLLAILSTAVLATTASFASDGYFLVRAQPNSPVDDSAMYISIDGQIMAGASLKGGGDIIISNENIRRNSWDGKPFTITFNSQWSTHNLNNPGPVICTIPQVGKIIGNATYVAQLNDLGNGKYTCTLGLQS